MTESTHARGHEGGPNSLGPLTLGEEIGTHSDGAM